MEKKKFFIILSSVVLAAFCGSFIAGRMSAKNNFTQPSYFIPAVMADSAEMSKQFDVMMENHQKIIEKMNKEMDALMKENTDSSQYFTVSSKVSTGNFTAIKTEEMPTLYKITIALSSFNNDPKNVNVEIKGNRVIISALYKANDNKEASSSQFYQSLTLASKIDANSIKKYQEKNSLIIEIPKKVKK